MAVTIEAFLAASRGDRNEWAEDFMLGWESIPQDDHIVEAKSIVAGVRTMHGFKPQYTPLLTPPHANTKLDAASGESWGLTLQSFYTRLRDDLTVNTCPLAGQCASVCVGNSGQAAYPSVQRAREWKTRLLVEHPWVFFLMLGHEMRRVADASDGLVWFRPNVNSDIDWHHLLGNDVIDVLTEAGYVMYGYTKDVNRHVTATAIWEAYSWNENSPSQHLGGLWAVSVVTDRPKGAPIDRTAVIAWLRARGLHEYHPSRFVVVDADKDDNWMVRLSGVPTPWRGGGGRRGNAVIVGDLSAKGKARKHRGGFVQRIYSD